MPTMMPVSEIVELAKHKTEKSMYMDDKTAVIKVADLDLILADLNASIDALIDRGFNPPEGIENMCLNDGTIIQTNLALDEVFDAINDYRYLANKTWESQGFVKYLRKKYTDKSCVIEVIKYGKGLIDA